MNPPKFSVRNEVDRFGFTYVLSLLLRRIGKIKTARCSWVHGWKWYDCNDYRLLGPESLSLRKKTIVVTNATQYEKLRDFNFTRIIKGGLPFSYVLNFNEINYNLDLPKDRNILVILPKSQNYMPSRSAFGEMISYVSDSSDLKKRAVFCVFDTDLNKQECVTILNSSGIPYISGASVDDPFALFRIRSIFSSFNYAITNTIGSHIPYLSAMGVNIKLCGPFDQRSAAFFSNDIKLKNYGDDYINYLEYVHSESYFRSKFGPQIDGNLDFSNRVSWGLNEIGYQNRISNEHLPYVLGWNAKGFGRAAYETCTRIVYDFIN